MLVGSNAAHLSSAQITIRPQLPCQLKDGLFCLYSSSSERQVFCCKARIIVNSHPVAYIPLVLRRNLLPCPFHLLPCPFGPSVLLMVTADGMLDPARVVLVVCKIRTTASPASTINAIRDEAMLYYSRSVHRILLKIYLT